MAAALAYRSKGSLSSSDSEDSDKECSNWKRITKNEGEDLEKIPIAPPPVEPSPTPISDGSLKRKRNNIWCEVLQDQIMSETLNHCGIKSKPKNYGDRGEESYDYRVGRGYREDDSDDMSDDSRTSSFTYRKKFKSDKYVELDTDGLAAAKKIVRTLSEQKAYLIFRIVKYLGIEKAKDFLKKTEDIEENGGMMIKNQERRRTPGGVYLHLVRSDDTIEKEVMDKIFEGELNSYEKKKKFNELRKKKKKKRNAKLHNNSKNNMDVDPAMGDNTENVASDDMEASNVMTVCPASVVSSMPVESERTSDLEEGEVE